MMTQLSVSHMSLTNEGFVLVFRTMDGRRILPVGIGLPEAQLFLLPNSPAHDLAKRLLDLLECRLERVDLCGLQNGTVACRIVTRLPSGELTSLNARAGDAVAMAMRTHAPIFADGAVLKRAGAGETGAGAPRKPTPASEEELQVETRHRLNTAIACEQYEEAARLRDELRHLVRHAPGTV